MKTNFNERTGEPTLYITKNKQRVKQYGNNIVYLKNGDNFELEIYNPTKTKVLAKITINGLSIGNGIILRPAERVFLERYIDEAKKFLFETYEVNGASKEVLEAIQNNGKIEVSFYKEKEYVSLFNNSGTYLTYNNPYGIYTSPNVYYGSTTTNVANYSTLTSSSYAANTLNISGSGCITGNLNFTSTAASGEYDGIGTTSKPTRSEFIETGRIEKGSVSNQTLVSDSTSFESYQSWYKSWNILPESRKLVTKEDLVVYCGSCGKKRKKTSDKYCSNCGNKF